MVFNFIILFLSAIVGGVLEFVFPQGYKSKGFSGSLIFAGSFLFALTVVHILPELFQTEYDRFKLGAFVLIGFFFQQFLETFSAGVEHGHAHIKSDEHHHKPSRSILILLGLTIHSLMEGALIAHPSTIHAHHDANTLLVGIALHKAPAAYALMSIITCYTSNRRICYLYLFIFALASPIGLLLSDWAYENQMISDNAITAVFALVSGSFLNISTTIFFESSPQHKLNLRYILTATVGALVAIAMEYIS